MRPNWLKILGLILILVFYGSLLLYKIELPLADDIARHVKNGQMILQGHFDVVYKNFYSYTEPDQPFINHHWLSGVVYFLLYKVIGWSGLVIFKIIILLAAFALLLRTATRKANFWLVALFSLPTILILGNRTGVRPENFSYLFIAVCLYILTDLDDHPESKKIFWLIPLQLLWVNLHIFFIAGPALVAGFLLEKIIHRNPLIKKLFLVLGGLVVVSLFNPNGIRGALYPLNIFNSYGILVSENQSIPQFLRVTPVGQNVAILAFAGAVLLLAISFIFAFWQKRRPYFYLLAAVCTTVAAIVVLRTLPFFALIFLPAISANFNHWPARIPAKTGEILQKALIVVLMVTFVIFTLVSVQGKFTPYAKPGIGLSPRSGDSANFFKDNKLKGPIFNDYDIGSYLIYNFFPQEKVFVDNRPEAYSLSFFNNTYLPMVKDDKKWQEMLAKYQFNTIYFYQYDEGDYVRQFMYKRAKDPAWALVYADSYAVIFVRNIPKNQEITKNLQITPKNVAQRLNYLVESPGFDDEVAAADIYNMVGRSDLAQEQFLKIVLKWPHKGKVWQTMGEWELGMDDQKSPLLAIMFLERGIAEGYKTAEGYSFLGAAYIRLGQQSKARAALREALRINPERQDAKDLLDRLNGFKVK